MHFFLKGSADRKTRALNILPITSLIYTYLVIILDDSHGASLDLILMFSGRYMHASNVQTLKVALLWFNNRCVAKYNWPRGALKTICFLPLHIAICREQVQYKTKSCVRMSLDPLKCFQSKLCLYVYVIIIVIGFNKLRSIIDFSTLISLLDHNDQIDRL